MSCGVVCRGRHAGAKAKQSPLWKTRARPTRGCTPAASASRVALQAMHAMRAMHASEAAANRTSGGPSGHGHGHRASELLSDAVGHVHHHFQLSTVYTTGAQLQASPWWQYYERLYGPMPSAETAVTYPFWPLARTDILYPRLMPPPLLHKVQSAVTSVEYKRLNSTAHANCHSLLDGSIYDRRSSDLFDPIDTLYVWHKLGRAEHAAPNHSWVEVTHCAGVNDQKYAHYNFTFFYLARGSGNWVYTGRTNVIWWPRRNASEPPQSKHTTKGMHNMMFREKGVGYDTLQFVAQDDQTCGNNAVEIVHLRRSSYDACRAADYRSGWGATRECACRRHKPRANRPDVPGQPRLRCGSCAPTLTSDEAPLR